MENGTKLKLIEVQSELNGKLMEVDNDTQALMDDVITEWDKH